MSTIIQMETFQTLLTERFNNFANVIFKDVTLMIKAYQEENDRLRSLLNDATTSLRNSAKIDHNISAGPTMGVKQQPPDLNIPGVETGAADFAKRPKMEHTKVKTPAHVKEEENSNVLQQFDNTTKEEPLEAPVSFAKEGPEPLAALEVPVSSAEEVPEPLAATTAVEQTGPSQPSAFAGSVQKMEASLIIAVSDHPVLYDTTLPTYKDRNKKDAAWREISVALNVSADTCRRKWKNLRDTYLRNKRIRREGERSGSAAGSASTWKHTTVMAFLDKFVASRKTSTNFDMSQDEHQSLIGDPTPGIEPICRATTPSMDSPPGPPALGSTEITLTDCTPAMGHIAETPAVELCATPPPQLAEDPSNFTPAVTPQRPRGKKRKDSVGDLENEILQAIKFHGNNSPTHKISHCLLEIQERIEPLPKMKQQELQLKLHQLAFEFVRAHRSSE
ncbi:uncharacterized protein LOC130922220 isoform X1 [Corythoichthys intestinalis]|uniref:uncharacterized protein LOC130922220 isoform X1 n=1 Tax=Corythoichthys intestinalis TaxID=161448 RepID=UPI0025A5F2DB|nr:uncharacterized protein LOC130922220 isoform X1 [Corythoichthys intestinalis]